MTAKLIFLSHIHEERLLAALMKEAIENEFGGFVDVFVSSDGTTIPAGSNFLKRIEDGLLGCIGAIYLLSPASIKRNWVNFELGAVWIRNITSLRAGGSEVPTLPLCHSGMVPTALPVPLSNLNGVVANQASQLEFAFRSLQAAVGGKGMLRTDFDALAGKVMAFEQSYTVGANLKKTLVLLGFDSRVLLEQCESQRNVAVANLKSDFVETSAIQAIRAFEAAELKDKIVLNLGASKIQSRPTGPVTGAEVELQVSTALILQFKDELLT